MKRIKKAYFCSCSNGLDESGKKQMEKVEERLKSAGVCLMPSPLLYRTGESARSAAPKERAEFLNRAFCDAGTDAIFDVSGGDLAVEVLPYLDYDKIRCSNALFFGYSDLTTVLNAIFVKAQKKSVLYQIRNLAREAGENQNRRFLEALEGKSSLFEPAVRMCHKDWMEGILIGGNIRCLLKLSGTEYFPDPEGKILFLECLHGKEPQLRSMFMRLKLLGVLDRVSGILLGTFTEWEEEGGRPSVEQMLLELLGDGIPVAKTQEVGHGADSKALIIGERVRIDRDGIVPIQSQSSLPEFG